MAPLVGPTWPILTTMSCAEAAPASAAAAASGGRCSSFFLLAASHERESCQCDRSRFQLHGNLQNIDEYEFENRSVDPGARHCSRHPRRAIGDSARSRLRPARADQRRARRRRRRRRRRLRCSESSLGQRLARPASRRTALPSSLRSRGEHGVERARARRRDTRVAQPAASSDRSTALAARGCSSCAVEPDGVGLARPAPAGAAAATCSALRGRRRRRSRLPAPARAVGRRSPSAAGGDSGGSSHDLGQRRHAARRRARRAISVPHCRHLVPVDRVAAAGVVLPALARGRAGRPRRSTPSRSGARSARSRRGTVGAQVEQHLRGAARPRGGVGQHDRRGAPARVPASPRRRQCGDELGRRRSTARGRARRSDRRRRRSPPPRAAWRRRLAQQPAGVVRSGSAR